MGDPERGETPQGGVTRTRVVLLGAAQGKALRKGLCKQLSAFAEIEAWTPDNMTAGAFKADEARARITKADVLVLMASADFVDAYTDATQLQDVRAAIAGGACRVLRVNESANLAAEVPGLREVPAIGTPDAILDALSAGELEKELVVIARQIAGRALGPPGGPNWILRAAVAVGLLAGGVAAYAWWSAGEPPTPIPGPPAPPKVALVPFPPDSDRRPVVRVVADEDTAAKLIAKCRPVKPGVAPTGALAPVPARRGSECNDTTSAATLAQRVAKRLGEQLPMFRFVTSDAEPTEYSIVLSTQVEDDGRWPGAPAVMYAQVKHKGEKATARQPLCTFRPSTKRSENLRSLKERFKTCEAEIAEGVQRWSGSIRRLFAQIPFMTRGEVVGATQHVATQLLHRNLVETPDQLETAFFSFNYGEDGAMPFRVCPRDQISGYLTTNYDLSVVCAPDPPEKWRIKNDAILEWVYLANWGGAP